MSAAKETRLKEILSDSGGLKNKEGFDFTRRMTCFCFFYRPALALACNTTAPCGRAQTSPFHLLVTKSDSCTALLKTKKKQLVIYPNVDRTYLAWSPTKSECVHRAIFYVIEMILCGGSGWSYLMPLWQRWPDGFRLDD